MSEQCLNPGAFKFTWPGRNEAHICATCVENLKAIAAAMGMYLQIREIPEDEQWQCQQMVSREKQRDCSTK
jgi:hypothetical protein